MLDGMAANRIIVGAYVDRQGGVCPMLAAHRNGGRTSLASFARAWDRYTGAGKGPRTATARELQTLRSMLEASLGIDTVGPLADAISEHRALKARHPAVADAPARRERAPRRDTGERDRTSELRKREGWAWLRPFRRLDDYERAMREVERIERERSGERERTPA
jgi:hypothetical protein